MTRATKLYERLCSESFTGWTYQDLRSVLLRSGFAEVSRSGSHRTFKHPSHSKLLTLKEQPGELPAGYPREALRRLQQLERNNDDH